ncbi:MAG: hypothetical protein E7B66_09855 [Klebsiella pneumoniae]|nr:hypothetical protein [Klebsiella pneumoniae]
MFFCYITDNDITFVSGCRVIFLNGIVSPTARAALI